MKHARLLSMVVLLVLCFALPCYAEPIPPQTPPAPLSQTGTPADTMTYARLIDQWSADYSEKNEWKALNELCEAEGVLPKEVLLRLTITYCIDTYQELTLADIAAFEPRFERSGETDSQILIMRSMTIQGDVMLTIDAKTGELLDSATFGGGNG